MGADLPKQYLPLSNKSLLEVTLEVIHQAFPQAMLILPLHPEDRWWPDIEKNLKQNHPGLKLLTCIGGSERADSVLAGLKALEGQAHVDDWVLVHDVARPCVSRQDLQQLWDQLQDSPGGGLLGAPVADTMKRSNADQKVVETVERKQLWHALTPQMFRFGLLKQALETALDQGLAITDEASALEAAGYQPQLVAGSRNNLKVTLPEDLPLAEKILKKDQGTMRIGQGFDVHKFGPGDHVILGGVQIPYEQGLVAHSDGDVLIHALCDALLGACALGDIGHHFPDTDPAYAGADSRELLRQVIQAVTAKGYRLVNADMTLIAQAPKMAPHLPAMLNKLAEDLQTPVDNLNIKATTTEKLGFTGRKEGIAAQAIVLLEKS
jgi:2-C-methyl-D-erythritol 2,4-cyclodiphosphate synthase/2-C-methyl-D-erythritol 4-phosphate cytidylyltransferase